MLKEVLWKFPLPRTHTGIALGNAVTGLLLWGEENHLRITIGRADFWDNRGGLHWNEKQNYFDIRKYLETNNETALLDIFKTDTEDIPGQPKRPSVIPVGRIDFSLPEGAILKTGILELENAQAKVQYTRNNRDYEIKINLSMEYQRFCVEADKSLEIKPVPAWEFLGDYFKSISIEAPLIFDGGWIQDLPKNEGICIAYKKIGNTIYVLNERAENIERLKNKAIESLNHFISGGVPSLKKSNVKWWHDYWTDIPKIEIPNKTLEFCYYYGLYKFAGLTNPAGVPATLQGPWIEEYDMPPWASDYHFNINVQMCYWPAYRANRLNHLMPLFKLVWSWRNRLRKNAEAFVGIKDGFMLPHAVDDKCTCMGSFWTGMIDHACTAWIAQMMFRYVKFSNDMKFLEETAYPFMKGTMRVFEEILEKHNGSYSLPISVSPEYRGKAMNAWGKMRVFNLPQFTAFVRI